MTKIDKPVMTPDAALVDLLSTDRIDALLAEADASGTGIDGPDGLLARMTKAVIERALDAEIADHLGYEAGDPAGHGTATRATGTAV